MRWYPNWQQYPDSGYNTFQNTNFRNTNSYHRPPLPPMPRYQYTYKFRPPPQRYHYFPETRYSSGYRKRRSHLEDIYRNNKDDDDERVEKENVETLNKKSNLNINSSYENTISTDGKNNSIKIELKDIDNDSQKNGCKEMLRMEDLIIVNDSDDDVPAPQSIDMKNLSNKNISVNEEFNLLDKPIPAEVPVLPLDAAVVPKHQHINFDKNGRIILSNLPDSLEEDLNWDQRTVMLDDNLDNESDSLLEKSLEDTLVIDLEGDNHDEDLLKDERSTKEDQQKLGLVGFIEKRPLSPLSFKGLEIQEKKSRISDKNNYSFGYARILQDSTSNHQDTNRHPNAEEIINRIKLTEDRSPNMKGSLQKDSENNPVEKKEHSTKQSISVSIEMNQSGYEMKDLKVILDKLKTNQREKTQPSSLPKQTKFCCDIFKNKKSPRCFEEKCAIPRQRKDSNDALNVEKNRKSPVDLKDKMEKKIDKNSSEKHKSRKYIKSKHVTKELLKDKNPKKDLFKHNVLTIDKKIHGIAPSCPLKKKMEKNSPPLSSKDSSSSNKKSSSLKVSKRVEADSSDKNSHSHSHSKHKGDSRYEKTSDSSKPPSKDIKLKKSSPKRSNEDTSVNGKASTKNNNNFPSDFSIEKHSKKKVENIPSLEKNSKNVSKSSKLLLETEKSSKRHDKDSTRDKVDKKSVQKVTSVEKSPKRSSDMLSDKEKYPKVHEKNISNREKVDKSSVYNRLKSEDGRSPKRSYDMPSLEGTSISNEKKAIEQENSTIAEKIIKKSPKDFKYCSERKRKVSNECETHQSSEDVFKKRKIDHEESENQKIANQIAKESVKLCDPPKSLSELLNTNQSDNLLNLFNENNSAQTITLYRCEDDESDPQEVTATSAVIDTALKVKEAAVEVKSEKSDDLGPPIIEDISPPPSNNNEVEASVDINHIISSNLIGNAPTVSPPVAACAITSTNSQAPNDRTVPNCSTSSSENENRSPSAVHIVQDTITQVAEDTVLHFCILRKAIFEYRRVLTQQRDINSTIVDKELSISSISFKNKTHELSLNLFTILVNILCEPDRINYCKILNDVTESILKKMSGYNRCQILEILYYLLRIKFNAFYKHSVVKSFYDSVVETIKFMVLGESTMVSLTLQQRNQLQEQISAYVNLNSGQFNKILNTQKPHLISASTQTNVETSRNNDTFSIHSQPLNTNVLTQQSNNDLTRSPTYHRQTIPRFFNNFNMEKNQLSPNYQQTHTSPAPVPTQNIPGILGGSYAQQQSSNNPNNSTGSVKILENIAVHPQMLNKNLVPPTHHQSNLPRFFSGNGNLKNIQLPPNYQQVSTVPPFVNTNQINTGSNVQQHINNDKNIRNAPLLSNRVATVENRQILPPHQQIRFLMPVGHNQITTGTGISQSQLYLNNSNSGRPSAYQEHFTGLNNGNINIRNVQVGSQFSRTPLQSPVRSNDGSQSQLNNNLRAQSGIVSTTHPQQQYLPEVNAYPTVLNPNSNTVPNAAINQTSLVRNVDVANQLQANNNNGMQNQVASNFKQIGRHTVSGANNETNKEIPDNYNRRFLSYLLQSQVPVSTCNNSVSSNNVNNSCKTQQRRESYDYEQFWTEYNLLKSSSTPVTQVKNVSNRCYPQLRLITASMPQSQPASNNIKETNRLESSKVNFQISLAHGQVITVATVNSSSDIITTNSNMGSSKPLQCSPSNNHFDIFKNSKVPQIDSVTTTSCNVPFNHGNIVTNRITSLSSTTTTTVTTASSTGSLPYGHPYSLTSDLSTVNKNNIDVTTNLTSSTNRIKNNVQNSGSNNPINHQNSSSLSPSGTTITTDSSSTHSSLNSNSTTTNKAQSANNGINSAKKIYDIIDLTDENEKSRPSCAKASFIGKTIDKNDSKNSNKQDNLAIVNGINNKPPRNVKYSCIDSEKQTLQAFPSVSPSAASIPLSNNSIVFEETKHLPESTTTDVKEHIELNPHAFPSVSSATTSTPLSNNLPGSEETRNLLEHTNISDFQVTTEDVKEHIELNPQAFPSVSAATTPALVSNNLPGSEETRNLLEPTSTDVQIATDDVKEHIEGIDDIIDLTWIDNFNGTDEDQTKNTFIKYESLKIEETTINNEQIPKPTHVQSRPNVSTSDIASSVGTQNCDNEIIFDMGRKCICGNVSLYICLCRTVMYCGEDCQKAHWNEHKISCCSVIDALEISH